ARYAAIISRSIRFSPKRFLISRDAARRVSRSQRLAALYKHVRRPEPTSEPVLELPQCPTISPSTAAAPKRDACSLTKRPYSPMRRPAAAISFVSASSRQGKLCIRLFARSALLPKFLPLRSALSASALPALLGPRSPRRFATSSPN